MNVIVTDSDIQDFPSVDDSEPEEEGGPTARLGFNFQDEVAVHFLIEMLENQSLIKVHCETQDDIVLVYGHTNKKKNIAEYVQVKATQPDQLWTIAELCKKSKKEKSIFEKSLLKDKHDEISRFRIVTRRDISRQLKILSYNYDTSGPRSNPECYSDLKDELDKRFPEIQSAKNNGTDYWLTNCRWCVFENLEALKNANLIRIIEFCAREGCTLLPDFAEDILVDLRRKAKLAGDARWREGKAKKIILRENLLVWWEQRKLNLIEGAQLNSGEKLKRKMTKAKLSSDQITLALDLRRQYSRAVRTSRYMVPNGDEWDRLQNQVKSELLSLRADFMAGSLEATPAQFHAQCLGRMEDIHANLLSDCQVDAWLLKGYLYDMADRCLLRFERALQ